MGREKCRIDIRKIYILLALLFTFLFLSGGAQSVYAAGTGGDTGWVNHEGGIYSEKAPKKTNESEDGEQNYYKDEFNGYDANWIESLFGQLLYAPGAFLNKYMGRMGFDLDSIVLGRVHYEKNDVNLLGFEFSEGNPYGIMGALLYKIFRSIIFLILVVEFEAYISKYLYKMSSRENANIKSDITSTLMMFGVLILLPYVLDYAIYLRDVFLAFMRTQLAQETGIQGMSLWNSFSQAAEKTNYAIVPSALCLATAALSIIFISSYALIALTNMLLFIAFPIICGYYPSRRKKTLEEWLIMFLANILIPIFDYALIVFVSTFPLILGENYGLAAMIVQLFLAWLIIPARNTVLNILSLRTAAPISGLGTLMGLMAAARMLKNAGKRIGNIAGNVENGFGDLRSADQEKELGEIGGEDREEARPYYSKQSSESDGDNKNNEGSTDEEYGTDFSDENETDGSEDNVSSDTTDTDVDIDTDADVGTDTDNSTDRDSGSQSDSDNEESEIEVLESDNADLRDRNADINRELGNNERRIAGNEKDIENLEAENDNHRASLGELNAKGDSSKAKELQNKIDANQGRIDDKRAQNNNLRATNEALKDERRNNNRQIARNNDGIAQHRLAEQQRQRMQNQYGFGMRNRYDPKTATPEMQKKHDIILKRANVKNFDSPEMAGMLSHSEMADFYRKRAIMNFSKAAGGAGAMAAGGAIGMAAGTFLGPTGMMYGTDMASGLGYGAVTLGIDAGFTNADSIGTILRDESGGGLSSPTPGHPNVVPFRPRGTEYTVRPNTYDNIVPINDVVPATDVINREGVFDMEQRMATAEERLRAKEADNTEGLSEKQREIYDEAKRMQEEITEKYNL